MDEKATIGVEHPGTELRCPSALKTKARVRLDHVTEETQGPTGSVRAGESSGGGAGTSYDAEQKVR